MPNPCLFHNKKTLWKFIRSFESSQKHIFQLVHIFSSRKNEEIESFGVSLVSFSDEKLSKGFLFIDYVMRWFFPKVTYWLLKLSAAFFNSLPLPFFLNQRGFSTWINRFYGFVFASLRSAMVGTYAISVKNFLRKNNKKIPKTHFYIFFVDGVGRDGKYAGSSYAWEKSQISFEDNTRADNKKIPRIFFPSVSDFSSQFYCNPNRISESFRQHKRKLFGKAF